MKLPPATIATQGQHHVTAETKQTQHCCDSTTHEIIIATCTCTCGWQTRATTRRLINNETDTHIRKEA